MLPSAWLSAPLLLRSDSVVGVSGVIAAPVVVVSMATADGGVGGGRDEGSPPPWPRPLLSLLLRCSIRLISSAFAAFGPSDEFDLSRTSVTQQ